MSTIDWSAPVSHGEMAHRAGGRRRYNAVRQVRAMMRRVKVSELLLQGLSQAQIARRLGVHRCTISRDVASLRQLVRESRQCPTCGQTLDALAHRGGAYDMSH